MNYKTYINSFNTSADVNIEFENGENYSDLLHPNEAYEMSEEFIKLIEDLNQIFNSYHKRELIISMGELIAIMTRTMED